jgi:formylmethanofuran dehydrogenase subunit E
MKQICLLAALLLAASAAPALAHEDETNTAAVHSTPGENLWNTGKPPADWKAEVRREHGHLGPWNVLGYRIAQTAMREFKTTWGSHDLDIIYYEPMETPYSCLADGLSVGTGNSIGRLDLRLAEVFTSEQVCVAVRRKDGKGGIIEFHPKIEYLKIILTQPAEKIEDLSRQCEEMPQESLFWMKRLENNNLEKH